MEERETYSFERIHQSTQSDNSVPPPPPPIVHGVRNNSPCLPYPHNYSYKYSCGYYAPGISTQFALHDSKSQTKQMPPTGQNELPASATTESIQPPKVREVILTKSTWQCKECNLTLESESALKSHCKTHVKCSDCSYVASPKLVKAHYQAAHGKYAGSGFKTVTIGVPGCRPQKFKICVGNRPEDIQRWITERKKRFPRRRATNSNTIKLVSRVNTSSEESLSQKLQTDDKTKTIVASGLSSLLAGYGSSDDDGKEAEKEENDVSKTRRNLTFEVGGRCGNSYQCSDEVGERREQFKFTQNDARSGHYVRKEKRRTPCKYFLIGSCAHGKNCRFSHDLEQVHHQCRPSLSEQKSHSISTPLDQSKSTVARKRKRSGHISSDFLLRKLLDNDIERESSFAIQLLKFIVDNEFFENRQDNDPPEIAKIE